MVVHTSWALDALIAEYGQYVRRTRGLRQRTFDLQVVYLRRFLCGALGSDPIDVRRLDPADVLGFMLRCTEGLRPRTIGSAAAALRSFFRFLRAQGLCDARLEAAVPSVAQRRLESLPLGLSDEDLARLLRTAASGSGPCALRDRAVVVTLAGLGLRPCELADLRLDEIDWRAGVVQVGAHKTRRDGVLPLPRDVGAAIVAYLRTERPQTDQRRVFVHHGARRRGAPLRSADVSGIVAEALERAGIVAPIRGAYLLRHTLASRMVRHGTSLKEVADFMGHRSLDTTTIYAKLDLPALREVALPWPEATS